MPANTQSMSYPDFLRSFHPQSDIERHDLARIRQLFDGTDPWDRSLPLHLTASALVVHSPSRTLLLRWHERQQAWLHVGGHGDPGERDPLLIALREATEETGLHDLAPLAAQPGPIHVVCVPVPANGAEPAHEHADVRFVLLTSEPDRATPENEQAPLRWLTFDEARAATTEDNLRETLTRAERLITG